MFGGAAEVNALYDLALAKWAKNGRFRGRFRRRKLDAECFGVCAMRTLSHHAVVGFEELLTSVMTSSEVLG